MEEKENQFVIIPLVDFEELTETKTKYAILANHIESVLKRGDEEFSVGLFRAVIDWKEGVANG